MAKVTVINTTNVTNFQPAYKSLGLGQIPAGTTVDAAVATIEKALFTKLSGGWSSTEAPYDNTQQDSGIMAPWSANVPGTAPACVTQQLTSDFNDWELPNDTTTINEIASAITQQIGDNGGNAGTFYGKHSPASSETIFWGVGFATAVVVDNPEETGIIYVFSAALGLN